MQLRLPSVALTLSLLLAGCGGTERGEFRTVKADGASETPAEAIEAETRDTSATPATDPLPEEGPAVVEAESPADPPLTEVVTLVAAEVEAPADSVEPEEGVRRSVEPLVPEPEFRRERDGALRVSFDDIDLKRIIDVERPTVDTPRDLPEWLSALDGQRIRIAGFMKPNERVTDIPHFIFVRDNGVCCFGQQAKLYDMIHVRLREGTTTDFIQGRPFDVEGVFRIKPTVFLDELVFFYHLENAAVVPD